MNIIGVDPSIDSTGICCLKDGEDPIYYLIVSSNKYKSKKMQEFIKTFDHDRLHIRFYHRCDVSWTPYTLTDYSLKEYLKTTDFNVICNHLKDIIQETSSELAFIEGISYGSAGHVVDLAGLNYLMRKTVISCNVMECIIAPTENKKIATGNGAAKKEEMIYAWHACDDIWKDIDKRIKTDDLADAYFLAHNYDYWQRLAKTKQEIV